MQTLPNHFSGLLSNIEPSEERLKLAQQTPDLVRDYLKQSEDIIIVEPYSRLAGSYARHTAVGDIKDVDIVVFLNKDYKDEEPASVLRKLKKALDGLPNRSVVELRSQRRSIHVYFTDCDFHLDIVPAIAPNETTMTLLVPDKSQAKWIKSNPLGYNDYLSKINGENQDKVVPLIKLIKYWRNIQMIYKRPKSYWLECLVVHQIGKKVKVDGKSYAELFADMLDAIYDEFSYILNYTNKVPEIADPMLGHNVAFNWERSHFETFMLRVDESRKWARQSLDEDDDIKNIVDLWCKVFGDDFSEMAIIEGRCIANAIQNSGLFVTPKGRVVTTSSFNTVEIPKHRNYGDN